MNSSFLAFCRTIVADKDDTGKLRYPAEYIEILSFLCDFASVQVPIFKDQAYSTRQKKSHFKLDNLKTRSVGRTFESLKRAFKSAMLNRRLCWTKGGYLGLVPRHTLENDLVVVVPGGFVPLLLRRLVGGEEYHLIGESFFSSIMDGEVMKMNDLPLIQMSIM